ncbi:MAG: hypothetical protein Q8O74_08345 [bacterium]|nr:hypothetical protein [bacterium]
MERIVEILKALGAPAAPKTSQYTSRDRTGLKSRRTNKGGLLCGKIPDWRFPVSPGMERTHLNGHTIARNLLLSHVKELK